MTVSSPESVLGLHRELRHCQRCRFRRGMGPSPAAHSTSRRDDTNEQIDSPAGRARGRSRGEGGILQRIAAMSCYISRALALRVQVQTSRGQSPKLLVRAHHVVPLPRATRSQQSCSASRPSCPWPRPWTCGTRIGNVRKTQSRPRTLSRAITSFCGVKPVRACTI